MAFPPTVPDDHSLSPLNANPEAPPDVSVPTDPVVVPHDGASLEDIVAWLIRENVSVGDGRDTKYRAGRWLAGQDYSASSGGSSIRRLTPRRLHVHGTIRPDDGVLPNQGEFWPTQVGFLTADKDVCG